MADEQQVDGNASSPRDILIRWAKGQDAWVRLLVSAVLELQGPVGDDVVDEAFETFLKEKGFVDAIESAEVPPLPAGRDGDASQELFSLRRLLRCRGRQCVSRRPDDRLRSTADGAVRTERVRQDRLRTDHQASSGSTPA